jgi:NADH-quinone oxidoreductase subunit G
MTADKNPNRKGLEWIAKGLGLTLRPFEELSSGIESRSVKALYAVGAEVPADTQAFANVLARLEVVVVQAFNLSAVTAQAHVLLPAAPHVEDDGSFVNLEGVIQRFRRAYPAKGGAKGHWHWAAALARAKGAKLTAESARDVFKDLGARVPELSAFDWDKEAPALQARPGINPLPTGADGRPPGYREFGAPRVRGI